MDEEDESFLDEEEEVLSEPEQQLVQVDQEIKQLEKKEAEAIQKIEASVPLPQKPTEPHKASPDDFVFDFDVDKKEFPEMAIYENVMWTLADKDPTFNKGLFQVDWMDMKLNKIPNSSNYSLSLVSDVKTVKLKVCPVLTGKDLAVAEKEFAKKYEAYEVGLKEREDRIQKEKEELARQLEEERKLLAIQKLKFEEQLKELKSKE